MIFLQKTHSCEIEKSEMTNLKEHYSFCMEKQNSCRVTIGYSGAKSLILEERKTDKNDRF